MQKLDEAEKKTLIIWVIVGIIFAIVALLIEINFDFHKNAPVVNEKIKYVKVKDYSRYYTVKTALSKFYSFSNANNTNSILNILDSKYKLNKKLNEENVKDILGIKNNNLDIETEIILELDKDDKIMTYLVKANEVIISSSKYVRTVYYKVLLDGSSYHFIVEPIDESVYLEALNG